MRKLRAGSVLIGALLLTLTAWPVFGQQVKMPRAKAPLLLFGFEGPDGLKPWIEGGFKLSTTDKHFSEGKQAMTFVVQKTNSDGIDYPMATIHWDNGKGYSTKDWSHYGKIAFDVWVEGDKPQDLSIVVANKPGQVNGVSERFTIQPGKKNTIELSDAMGTIDRTDIEEFIFFAGLSHPTSYTVTIDNVRLLPGDKSPLADFDLVYPNYRETILPDGKSLKASVTVNCDDYGLNPKDLSVSLTAVAGKKTVSRTMKVRGEIVDISIPVKKLPAGEVKLTGVLKSKSENKVLATQTWTLKKVTRSEASAVKSYVDSHNNLIVDGKPFFPLGFYMNMTKSHLDEVADSPFNCVLSYGMDQQPKADLLKYMDRAQEKGLKIIYCMNDLYPTATYVDSWEGVKGNEAIAKSVVQSYKDHPAVIAWYLMDELPKSLLPSLQGYYDRVRADDPNHPCYIVLYNMADLKYFAKATDVLGSDPYPIPSNAVTQVSEETDTTVAAGNGHRAVWQALQSFGWYQHNSPNPDRAHKPTAEELKAGRAPSYEETRNMTYLALTHGSKGILYWCYYDMRMLPQYPEMWGWMKSIGSEVKSLSPMLLSNDDFGKVRYTSSGLNIHTKLKKYNGELYLMAVNSDSTAGTATFDIGSELTGEAKVMFENRSVKTSGTQLTDTFKPLEVHVYNLGETYR